MRTRTISAPCAWLWPQLRCPVYATPFAAAVLRRKLAEAQLLDEVKLHVVPPGGAFDLPPFTLRFMRVAHSIPEAQALVIRTPAGMVLHTGDWKLDPTRWSARRTDEAAFAALGERACWRWSCDSTNAMVEGHSGSEAEVRRTLSALIRGLQRPRRGDLLRQQRRARRIDRARRARCRPQRRRGRPQPAQPGCGGARVRLPEGHPAVPQRGRRRRRPRRQPADPDHRQPGRAAQRAGPRRDRHPSAHRAGRGRHGGVLAAASSPATSARSARCRTIWCAAACG